MSVLDKLLTNGQNIGIFKVLLIKDIPKSCCKCSETPAIDFDYAKEELSKSMNKGYLGFNMFKSCDALKFLEKSERVDFIEFKGFEDFKKWNKIQSPDDNRIDKQVKKMGLNDKIDDSCVVFNTLIKITNLKLSKDDLRELKQLEWNYIVAVDIEIEENPIQNIAATLQLLSEKSISDIDTKIVKCIEDEINCTSISYKVNKPIIKSCKDIDNYYSTL